MTSNIETLDDNQVKLTFEVPEDQINGIVDRVYRELAREVRIPGFRPGKAPRKVLEARVGAGYARGEALQERIPEVYQEVVNEHEVDVISRPSFDIVDGEDAGVAVVTAVVSVRPSITIEGYDNLTVEIPRPAPNDEDVQQRVDQLRSRFASLRDVERPVESGDHVTIDISSTLGGEPFEFLTADDFLYKVGSGSIVPEIDDALLGASLGDTVEFDAEHPDDEEDDLEVTVVITAVQEEVLPEVDDEFAAEAGEFADAADLLDRITRQTQLEMLAKARMALQQATVEALAALTDVDPPDEMVQSETASRLQEFAMRLGRQGATAEGYLAQTGQTSEDLLDEFRTDAITAVRVDLTLRAIADAESIEVSEDDVEEYLESAAAQSGMTVDEIRHEFEHHKSLWTVRSDLRKQKALEWVMERVTATDEEGESLDVSTFEADWDELIADLSAGHDHDHDHDHHDHDHHDHDHHDHDVAETDSDSSTEADDSTEEEGA